jgi:uncharacterized protein
MTISKEDTQADVIGFLTSAKAYPNPGPVSHIETHGAHVFLCGDVALKIKRAVKYDYLDQSTLAQRQALLLRELDLNRAAAPMIYRDVIPVTRGADGRLDLNGAGPPVEWVLRMHRFATGCEMTELATDGKLTDKVAEALGRVIQGFHATCAVRNEPGDDLIREILDELERVLTPFDAAIGGGCITLFLGPARQHLNDLAPRLKDRTSTGHVRRVHGDLHLRNLLLIDGRPVLFDALEFDERLATCDVLYDLAFLLMDLCHRDLHRQANIAMAAYLLAAAQTEDSGLAALPLFMAVRAAIRAMVVLQTDQATGRIGENIDEARHYLTQAARYLRSGRPVLIAVGGVSGTGKTVLARDIATRVGCCPGAVHLRTDTERKARSGTVTYDPAARSGIYDQMLSRASTLLAAGRSVVLDGTFLDPAQRRAARDMAARLDIAFGGLWLTAPAPVLIERVTSRRDDASDADACVVTAQMSSSGRQINDRGWMTIDASKTKETTKAAAFATLAAILDGKTLRN